MEVLSYYDLPHPDCWLKKIGESDWTAGKFLYTHLAAGTFRKLYGEKTQLLLLADGDCLASFCTYAEKDDIQDTDLAPWMGFVYTFPEYRGRRLMGKLIRRAKELAREDGYEFLYICTEEDGLYGKYGAEFLYTAKDRRGGDAKVFRMDAYGFAGWENALVPARTGEYPGIRTPRDLYSALWHVWTAETCAPRMRQDWSEDNRTLGQCSVTAFLAQDIFGGKVYGIPLEDGGFHCYNAVENCVFDLTSEQFPGQKLKYEGNPEQFREEHFRKDEKRARYELLKSALKSRCEAPQG